MLPNPTHMELSQLNHHTTISANHSINMAYGIVDDFPKTHLVSTTFCHCLWLDDILIMLPYYLPPHLFDCDEFDNGLQKASI